MADEKEFKKMRSGDIKALFQEVVEKIQQINLFAKELEEKKQAIAEADNKVNGENGFLANIKKKSEEIEDTYNQICVNDDNGDSIKKQAEDLLSEFEEIKGKFGKTEKDFFGYEKKDGQGNVQKTEGLLDKINNFHEKQKDKYTTLYKQIEEELKAGATSVNLSQSFADKVGEYHKSSRLWSVFFVILLIALIAYYAVATFSSDEIRTADDVWRHLAFRLPFLTFGVWLAIFFGNRRAESTKLGESYKHKEVMARSFVGYKKILEELGDADKVLLKQHMGNLLEAMKKDSATFLNSEGDKHPFWEAISSFFKSKKNASESK